MNLFNRGELSFQKVGGFEGGTPPSVVVERATFFSEYSLKSVSSEYRCQTGSGSKHFVAKGFRRLFFSVLPNGLAV